MPDQSNIRQLIEDVSVMNYDLIEELLSWLRDPNPNPNPNLQFDMSSWQVETDCGTSCCLAGAAVQFADPDFAAEQLRYEDGVDERLDSKTPERAAELLGLDARTAQLLFMPWDEQGLNYDSFALLYDLSPKGAIHALTTLRDTGTPQWPRI